MREERGKVSSRQEQGKGKLVRREGEIMCVGVRQRQRG